MKTLNPANLHNPPRVRLVYGPEYRQWVQPHLIGATGVIIAESRRGKGPRNVMVQLDDGGVTIVPFWNTRRIKEA